jgi:prevent-host-death family protein
MSATVTVEEAQAKLKELIHQLVPGEEVVITENAQPIATLISAPAQQPRPVPGRGKGTLIIHGENNDHLEDFKEYMP